MKYKKEEYAEYEIQPTEKQQQLIEDMLTGARKIYDRFLTTEWQTCREEARPINRAYALSVLKQMRVEDPQIGKLPYNPVYNLVHDICTIINGAVNRLGGDEIIAEEHMKEHNTFRVTKTIIQTHENLFVTRLGNLYVPGLEPEKNPEQYLLDVTLIRGGDNTYTVLLRKTEDPKTFVMNSNIRKKTLAQAMLGREQDSLGLLEDTDDEPVPGTSSTPVVQSMLGKEQEGLGLLEDTDDEPVPGTSSTRAWVEARPMPIYEDIPYEEEAEEVLFNDIQELKNAIDTILENQALILGQLAEVKLLVEKKKKKKDKKK